MHISTNSEFMYHLQRPCWWMRPEAARTPGLQFWGSEQHSFLWWRVGTSAVGRVREPLVLALMGPAFQPCIPSEFSHSRICLWLVCSRGLRPMASSNPGCVSESPGQFSKNGQYSGSPTDLLGQICYGSEPLGCSWAGTPWPGTSCAFCELTTIWAGTLDFFLLKTTWREGVSGGGGNLPKARSKRITDFIFCCLFCSIVFDFLLLGKLLALYHRFCNRNSLWCTSANLFIIRSGVSCQELLPSNSPLRILISDVYLIYDNCGHLPSSPEISFHLERHIPHMANVVDAYPESASLPPSHKALVLLGCISL